MACEKVIIERKQKVDQQLPGIHPILSRVYANRGIRSVNQLDYQLKNLVPPSKLFGMKEAIAIIESALDADAHILFVGDYDVDGATSCALGVLALTEMGARHVRFLVPNRFKYGYGLSPEIVKVASKQRPDVIITVDNGVASVEGVALAQSLGMSVIVTDHHLPGDVLPTADAIVNPNLNQDTSPSKAMAGVGVIFYVMLALRTHLRNTKWFTKNNIVEPNLANLLDLVALGTVADLVPLDYNNRILVSQGLNRIRAGQCRPGILALLEVAGRDYQRCKESDLGFAVGPRLNAAGRLDDMSIGIACLLADKPESARTIATHLDEINRERRVIQESMQQQALAAVEKIDDLTSDQSEYGYCLYDSGWHQGLIGLIASRVKEATHRPAIAFAPGEGNELKGSARSIAQLHIRDLLDRIATRHPGLITKFGGHAMAAGLSLETERLGEFKQAYRCALSDVLNESDLNQTLLTDGKIDGSQLDIELAELLQRSGPWGQSFNEPLFSGRFQIRDQRIVGDRHLKLKVESPGSSTVYDAIHFRYLDDSDTLPGKVEVELVYRLDINHFRDQETLQLIIEHLQT